jgi:hypothetical protein
MGRGSELSPWQSLGPSVWGRSQNRRLGKHLPVPGPLVSPRQPSPHSLCQPLSLFGTLRPKVGLLICEVSCLYFPNFSDSNHPQVRLRFS